MRIGNPLFPPNPVTPGVAFLTAVITILIMVPLYRLVYSFTGRTPFVQFVLWLTGVVILAAIGNTLRCIKKWRERDE